MKYFQPKPKKIAINITSLIDILFLIIIFFALSTRFDNEREKNLNLPASQEQEKQQIVDRLEITLDANQNLYVGNIFMPSMEDLLLFLKNYEHSRKVPILLRIDESIQHGDVISILDLLKQQNFEEISFGTNLDGF